MTLQETITKLSEIVEDEPMQQGRFDILSEALKWLRELNALLDNEGKTCPLCGFTPD